MKVIGLTGGVASGKSVVAAELAALGAHVLAADAAAHRVINLPAVKAQVVNRWGPKILALDGNVDRREVAKKVFSPGAPANAELRFLEALVHPLIRREFEVQIARDSDTGIPAVVVDAPLLLEAGWETLCDLLIFVDSPRETRLERAQRLRNWSAQEFQAREAAQLPIEEKRSRATHVLINQGSLAEIKTLVGQFWESNLPT